MNRILTGNGESSKAKAPFTVTWSCAAAVARADEGAAPRVVDRGVLRLGEVHAEVQDVVDRACSSCGRIRRKKLPVDQPSTELLPIGRATLGVGVVGQRKGDLLQVVRALHTSSRLTGCCTAGIRRPIRIAMMAMTTRSSISEKPFDLFVRKERIFVLPLLGYITLSILTVFDLIAILAWRPSTQSVISRDGRGGLFSWHLLDL